MKQLIVISSPVALRNEATIINALFDEGLELFHLRKPTYSNEALLSFVEQIQPSYHNRIVLPANVLKELPFVNDVSKRLHFFEHLRMQTNANDLDQLKKDGYSLSTSIHDVDTYGELHSAFSYSFFSPVLDSISKPGYQAMDKAQLNIHPVKNEIGLIALGGIDENNCMKALSYGFDGVALLGAIWQNEAPVATFRRIQKIIIEA